MAMRGKKNIVVVCDVLRVAIYRRSRRGHTATMWNGGHDTMTGDRRRFVVLLFCRANRAQIGAISGDML